MKKTSKVTKPAQRSQRTKCACPSCHCTVALDGGVRQGNLVYCSAACASRSCTVELCTCEHDCCAA
ncbi:MAG TPA: conjugal transfer protein TrbI [Verrucomicrobiae bacterium]|nr:conjugal transfer protein TrbI [Verrucomicrobiae bacterium]